VNIAAFAGPLSKVAMIKLRPLATLIERKALIRNPQPFKVVDENVLHPFLKKRFLKPRKYMEYS
jgi:hypothetical protein